MIRSDLSAGEARRLALWSQGLIGAPDRRAGPAGVLRHLGAVQLDTISVLARSHELVPYARLGPVGRPAVERAYWGAPHGGFEYWAHAACVLPLESWPWFTFRRRRMQVRGWRRAATDAGYDEVRRRLADLGPLTTAELGGSKAGGDWWSWSPLKIAVERLLAWGEVVCVERRGWRRVYDLAERAIPAELLATEPSDEECLRALVTAAGAAMGVATVRDLADYYRLAMADAQSVVGDTGLVPTRVHGWDHPAWAHPAALAALSGGRIRGRHRITVLSPFDSLVWFRARTERVFGFAHRLEAYVPAPQRVHGYFAMPLLAGGRLVGRVDPARETRGKEGTVLVVRRLSLAGPAWVPAAATALLEAASWVGCHEVSLPEGAVTSPAIEPVLRAALTA